MPEKAPPRVAAGGRHGIDIVRIEVGALSRALALAMAIGIIGTYRVP